MSFCSDNPDHMAKITGVPIWCKPFQKLLLHNKEISNFKNLAYGIYGLQLFQVYSNDDFKLTIDLSRKDQIHIFYAFIWGKY